MKLRAKHNSIRLRLTQSETVRLAETGKVEETIEFGLEPESHFVYVLEKSAATSDVLAFFEGRKIRVLVPETQADNWINASEVGIEAEQTIGNGKTLRILIEKDFACLAPRRSGGADDADAFPHPAAGEKNC